MEYRKIILSIDDRIARISLNSPQNFNALTGDMGAELIDALDRCEQEPAVRVVILSGEGRAFCAGGDLKDMDAILKSIGQMAFADGFRSDLKKVGDAARRIRRLRVPVIAAVHGAAAGTGCNLALHCDFKVASEDAKFIESFVNVGLIPDMGGSYILSRHLPFSRLNETLMLGKPITAAEALDHGLVNAVVSADSLKEETEKLAKQLKAMPAQSLAKIKRLVNLSLFDGLDVVLEAEEEYQHLCAQSDNFREGVNAFVEKRKPSFNA